MDPPREKEREGGRGRAGERREDLLWTCDDKTRTNERINEQTETFPEVDPRVGPREARRWTACTVRNVNVITSMARPLTLFIVYISMLP